VQYELGRREYLLNFCGKIEENESSEDLGADERKILKLV
jgi:hypothetical protein